MFLKFFKSSSKKQSAPTPALNIRVVIMGKDDTSTVGIKQVLSKSFESVPFLSVAFEDDFAPEDFLNPNHKNFFDFFDTGIKALKKHQADVLLRFYQDGANIRFNFLTPDMYFIDTPPFFSSMFGIYLPFDYFQTHSLPPQIAHLICASFVALCLKRHSECPQKLKDLINILSKNKMPQGIEKQFMPHVLNLLAFNYLALHANSFQKKDMHLILSLITSAKNTSKNTYDAALNGAMLTLLGQMYACAAESKNADSIMFFKRAAENTKKALKCFNKYVFPYDSGRLARVLAKFYFSLFKLSDNRQTLRDAVFYMREAEKIFTFSSFPNLWADIQGDLGDYLVQLSFYSKNKEVAETAIQNYKNRQKFYQKQTHPILWAKTQKSIADTYYYLGQNLQNAAYLEKASDSYIEAFEVFEQSGETEPLPIIENVLKKTQENFFRLNNK